MDIHRASRKSFDVEFVEVTEENISEVADWCGGRVIGEGRERHVRISDKNAIHTRQTKAFVGDKVVLHTEKKTFKAFGRRAFDNTFAVKGETPEDREVDRSAVTGQFVSHDVAEANPDTTVHESVHAEDAGLN